MKRLFQSIVLGMVIAAFALPALAQDTTTAQPAQQDEAAAKSELYKKFTTAYNRGKEIKKADPNLAQAGNKEAYNAAAKEAYDIAKQYVQKYPSDDDAIAKFQKKYITDYEKSEKEGRKVQLAQLFTDKKYDEGFALGRQILADDPNDLPTLYTLARNGLFAATVNDANNAATAQYARKAIQLIQSGTDLPGQPKDETLGVLNYALGVATIKTAPSDAVNAFYQVANTQNSAKSDPQTYYLLAIAYQTADYEKLASDYKAQCTTPEQIAGATCKAMTDRLNMVVDRVMDAYARAVSLSGSKPQYAAAKPEWMKQLTAFYKYRHDGKEDGLTEYIAGIANQPLPGPLPAAGATPAPTSSVPATNSTGDNSAATTNNSTMTPNATTTTTTTTTTPKATTTSMPATSTPKTTTTTPKTTTTTPKTTTTPSKTGTTPKSTPKKKAHAAGRQ
ncbi:MAG TPA: hypothetical protein VGC64_02535 [Pyrinomonadaceae bacterium]